MHMHRCSWCSCDRRDIYVFSVTGKNGSKKQAFHVVAPSLPGYGFSSAPKEPGFGPSEIAKTFDELMVALGYTSYVAQGQPLQQPPNHS